MSVFRDVLLFLDHVGIYDVVLPLLLIFSMVFAILEKTRIFGVEKIDGKEYTRKNINAMVAFVSAFFVVASAQLVHMINSLVANVSLLIVGFTMFLITIGVFSKDEELYLKGTTKTIFMVITGIGLLLIFFNALGWLMPAWYYIIDNWNSTVVSTILLLGGMGLFIWGISSSPSGQTDKKSDDK